MWTGAAPFASSATAVIYMTAQIRAAYSLPLLPATGSTLISVQAASLGSGQTIYIVDAYDDTNDGLADGPRRGAVPSFAAPHVVIPALSYSCFSTK